MKAAEILNQLRARGVIVEASSGRLRLEAPIGALTPELRTAISEQRSELLILIASRDPEVIWRVRAMLPQVPEHGPIPFLIARAGVEAPKGYCPSCGDKLSRPEDHRCTACGRAANLALELSMSASGDKTVQERQKDVSRM